MKVLIRAAALLLCFATPVFAQSDGVQQELSTKIKALTELLSKADVLVTRLRDTSKLGPVEAQLEVTKAAKTLGEFVDRLQDQGDFMASIRAIRSAAQIHRARVEKIPTGEINEADRAAALATWDKTLQGTDKATANATGMRDKFLGLITTLRQRQVGISELVLAESYQSAIQSLNQWLEELKKTVDDLHKAIGVPAA